MIRVVVTGSECTGKTTLATALAARYDAPLVREFARELVERRGTAPVYDDVGDIARGQIAAEEAAMADEPPLVIQDTDLVSTVTYSHHYYGDCPDWIEEALEDRLADLYLLAGIDVPWVPDGAQRDRGHRRPEMQSLFREALNDLGARFVDVRGPLPERVETARGLIDELLDESDPV